MAHAWPQRNGSFDAMAEFRQIVRQVFGVQVGFGRHHTATDIDPDG